MNLEYIRNLSRLGIEVWKDLPDFDIYQVSNLGNVRSLNYRNKKQIKKLKTYINNSGYNCLTLHIKGVKYGNKAVAPLVAMAFLNHKPCGLKLVVDHIDNNRLNDCLYNLQIVTNRYNCSKDKKGTSQYTGVGWHKASKKWRVRIQIKGINKYIGLYKNEIKAANAYQKALKEYEAKEIHHNTKNKKIREYSKSNLYEC